MSTPQAPFAAPPPPAGAPQLNFLNVLQRMLAVSDKVSDLIFSPGRPPQVELLGELQPVEVPGLEKLLPTHTAALAKIIIGNHLTAGENLQKFGSADLSFSAPGFARFRVNIFMQRGTHAIVMRVIPNRPPQWSDFDLPPVLKEIADIKNGLVLVTGPTGSGKSTTLAAMINHLNETEYGHILTVEDPIEFVHESKKCLVNQREVGPMTLSFANALKSALREDPDCILVGEMRDLETIRLAMTAAETGHLVFGTLHTSSAAKTIDRIIDVFPAEEKEMVRAMLSESLQAVISQTLCKTKDGAGRVAAHEIMIGTSAIRNLIREAKVAQMYSAIQTGNNFGMQTLDQNLTDLVKRNVISPAEARGKAKIPENFPG